MLILFQALEVCSSVATALVLKYSVSFCLLVWAVFQSVQKLNVYLFLFFKVITIMLRSVYANGIGCDVGVQLTLTLCRMALFIFQYCRKVN